MMKKEKKRTFTAFLISCVVLYTICPGAAYAADESGNKQASQSFLSSGLFSSGAAITPTSEAVITPVPSSEAIITPVPSSEATITPTPTSVSTEEPTPSSTPWYPPQTSTPQPLETEAPGSTSKPTSVPTPTVAPLTPEPSSPSKTPGPVITPIPTYPVHPTKAPIPTRRPTPSPQTPLPIFTPRPYKPIENPNSTLPPNATSRPYATPLPTRIPLPNVVIDESNNNEHANAEAARAAASVSLQEYLAKLTGYLIDPTLSSREFAAHLSPYDNTLTQNAPDISLTAAKQYTEFSPETDNLTKEEIINTEGPLEIVTADYTLITGARLQYLMKAYEDYLPFEHNGVLIRIPVSVIKRLNLFDTDYFYISIKKKDATTFELSIQINDAILDDISGSSISLPVSGKGNYTLYLNNKPLAIPIEIKNKVATFTIDKTGTYYLKPEDMYIDKKSSNFAFPFAAASAIAVPILLVFALLILRVRKKSNEKK